MKGRLSARTQKMFPRSGAVSVAVLLSLLSASEGETITAESGQNITLTCRASNTSVTVVEWRRPDQEPKYVLLNRDGHFDPHNQHPSFKNRVDLQDRQMKDGDVSLILRNVTAGDAGTYECRTFVEETCSWKSISIIYLVIVGPPDPPGGHTEGRPVGVTVSVTVVAVMVFVTFLICRTGKTFPVPSCCKQTQQRFCRRTEAHVEQT